LRGAVCEQPVEMIDLYSTLIELCGLPLKGGMQGVSLVPLLKNPNIPLHDAVFSQRALDLDQAKYGDPQARAVRTVKYHYNNWGDFGEELYDIQNDPHEYTNLASDPAYAAVLQDMRKLLAEFMGAHEPVTQPLFVFPNPATGTVTISYHSTTRANVHLKIYDAVGKLVFTRQEVASPGENRYQVFLGDLKTGAFILQLDNGDSPQQAKIIIQR